MATAATIERKMNEIFKGQHGGVRANAGRPPTKQLFTDRFNRMMEKKMGERMGKMIDAQIDAAIGVISEKYDKKKDELYYVEEGPSTAAFVALSDRAIGKPKERVEHSGAVGIVHLIKSLNQSDENIIGDSEQ